MTNRRAALERARLYFVAPGGFESLAGVLAAGVDVVQLRDKDADAAATIRRGEAFREEAAAAGALFIVNDRPDVALALGADGVHLGQDDLPPQFARRILGPHAIIGRSTHDREQIETAVAEHEAGLADYIAVGPVHATPTKPGRPAVGYELVRFAAARVAFPWFAIGGIDASNVQAVVQEGASRIAVVRAITEALDPAGAAAALLEALPCP